MTGRFAITLVAAAVFGGLFGACDPTDDLELELRELSCPPGHTLDIQDYDRNDLATLKATEASFREFEQASIGPDPADGPYPLELGTCFQWCDCTFEMTPLLCSDGSEPLSSDDDLLFIEDGEYKVSIDTLLADNIYRSYCLDQELLGMTDGELDRHCAKACEAYDLGAGEMACCLENEGAPPSGDDDDGDDDVDGGTTGGPESDDSTGTTGSSSDSTTGSDSSSSTGGSSSSSSTSSGTGDNPGQG